MNTIVPIAEAVLSGAVDSVENIAINLASKLPRWPKQHKQEPSACLDGKVAVVTGANAGIGYATAKQLAERGAHVVLACRSRERGEQAAQELSAVPPLPGCSHGSVEFAPLDLASLASVKDFVSRFNKGGRRLDVLVCNAGIMSPPQRLVTRDGLEMQFQVNFLSHFLLAHELLAEQRKRRAKEARKRQHSCSAAGCCRATSSNSFNQSPSAGTGRTGTVSRCSPDDCPCGVGGMRLVMLSSLTHPAGRVKWDDKQSAASYSPFTSYALSKLANTIMAAEYQRRFDRNSPCTYGHDTAVAIHPGIVATSLATTFFNQQGALALPGLQAVVQPVLSALYPLLLRTPQNSADSMMKAITAPRAQVAGRYMHNNRVARPARFAEAPEHGVELWELAESLTGVTTHDSFK